MARYTVQIDDLPVKWNLRDYPELTGRFRKNGEPAVDLVAAFIELKITNLSIVPQALMVLDPTDPSRFRFTTMEELKIRGEGNIVIRVMAPDCDPVTGAIIRERGAAFDTPLSGNPMADDALTIDLQTDLVTNAPLYVGSVPSVGFCRIEDEVMLYRFQLVEDGGNPGKFFHELVIEKRGLFGTTAAEHPEGATVHFATFFETVKPVHRFRVKDYDSNVEVG